MATAFVAHAFVYVFCVVIDDYKIKILRGSRIDVRPRFVFISHFALSSWPKVANRNRAQA
jgi:hypothetical protein